MGLRMSIMRSTGSSRKSRRAHRRSASIESRLKTSLFITTLFAVAQFAIGIYSGSLALISNSGHSLTDSVGLIVALLAEMVSKRKATTKKTYGYGRATVIAALANALLLIVFAAFILYWAYLRILNPAPVIGWIIAATAGVGVLISGGCALLLKKHTDDLNVKGAFLHAGLDSAALVGTLAAGLLIVLTGNYVFDPLISIVIGAMMLIGAAGILREAVNILLEGVPIWVDVEKIKIMLLRTRYVKEVHDLHVWSLTSNYAALSCHLVIEDCGLKKSREVVSGIKRMLKRKYNIEHSTIETELKLAHKKYPV